MVHRAVAQASLATGAPIMAHSNPSHRTGLAQVALLLEEGIAPEKIQVAHTGDTDDLGYIEALLATGVYIGMDRYGLDALFLGQEARNRTIAALAERGHGARILLGQDSCASIDWFEMELVGQLAPKWTMTLIFDEVFAELLELGVSQAQLDAMTDANVRAWLTA